MNVPSDGAMQRGCFLEDGLWKEYETDAGGHIKILFKTILVVFRKDGINVNPTSSLFYRENKLQKDKYR